MNINSARQPNNTTLQILTASYGPAEGRRLLNGSLVTSTNGHPYTRDVRPFLLALSATKRETGQAFSLLEGRSMNCVFGDPCPGTTKLLRVEYSFCDYYWEDGAARRNFRSSTSRVYQSTFAEHVSVLFKRQDPLHRLDVDDVEADGDKIERMVLDTSDPLPYSPSLENIETQSTIKKVPVVPSMPPWRLAPTISEITLPIILPFLTVRKRAMCQLVCSPWRDIVMERGIATVIDVNDPTLFPIVTRKISSVTHSAPFLPQSPSVDDDTTPRQDSSRALLRGLLSHSHSSLESLVLNDYRALRPSLDIHPTLPHLRKLKRLDISRIPSITDDTLHLLSTFIGPRLEVLYMKGLQHISNSGVVSLVQSCTNLRVLDVSHLPQLEDVAGIAIGRHLEKLEVFHARDNWRWTNASVDVITQQCEKLVQATFWGCTRLTHVCFEKGPIVGVSYPSSLEMHHAPVILLNLWGCHSLRDSSASLMSSLVHLRSLCVSECHKLSDEFVVGISQSLPQLIHLQLRYLCRITDGSIEAIASNMLGLYSLDVSFCTKLTVGGLSKLLAERCDTLAELRLYSCRQLKLDEGSMEIDGRTRLAGGRRLALALRTVRETSVLSFLDVRECRSGVPLRWEESFVKEMTGMGFQEELGGLFGRQAVWNASVNKVLGSKLNLDDEYLDGESFLERS